MNKFSKQNKKNVSHLSPNVKDISSDGNILSSANSLKNKIFWRPNDEMLHSNIWSQQILLHCIIRYYNFRIVSLNQRKVQKNIQIVSF